MSSQQGTFTADGDTPWFELTNYGPVTISLADNFGGGTVTVMQLINGNPSELRDVDNSNASITATDATNFSVDVNQGDIIGLNLSGSTGASLDWRISGRIQALNI
jgi:hypothetical protein